MMKLNRNFFKQELARKRTEKAQRKFRTNFNKLVQIESELINSTNDELIELL